MLNRYYLCKYSKIQKSPKSELLQVPSISDEGYLTYIKLKGEKVCHR
jgi:hypothetical protein